MIVCFSIIVFVLIVTLLFVGITLRLSKETKENFSGFQSFFLTDSASHAMNVDDVNKMNTPCLIKTKDGNFFKFRVENQDLGWFAVKNQPDTCSFDLSGSDLVDHPNNCNKTNNALYDSKVVKSVYWNDLVENPRCEVKFIANPDNIDMGAYLKKLQSYKTLTDCQEALREASRLKDVKAKLQQELQTSMQKERHAREIIAQKETQIAQLNDEIDTLHREMSILTKEYNEGMKKLADINEQIKSTENGKMQLQALMKQSQDDHERRMLEERSNQLRMKEKAMHDLQAQISQNAQIALESLENKQKEVDTSKARAENATDAAYSANQTLQKTISENEALQKSIQNTNEMIKFLQKGQPTTGGLEIRSPNYLESGGCIRSNKGYSVCVGSDGVIRVYNAEIDAQQRNSTKWEAHPRSVGKAPFKLYMQDDGNLCLYDDRGVPVWCTDTHGKGQKPFRAVIQDDGNFVVYDKNNLPTWATMTLDTPTPAPPDPFGPLQATSLMLKHEVSKKCLDTNLKLASCSSLNSVRWQPINKGRNKFSLKNIESGKCLDGNGSALYTLGCNDGEYQNWNTQSVNNESGRYVFKHAVSGKCLDSDGSSTYLHDCGSAYQIFRSS